MKIFSEKHEELKDFEEVILDIEKERDTLIKLISPEVYRIYRSISDIRKGIGLARATESCQGCHVRIRPSILSRVMGNQEILTCESCNRILYWQPDGPYEVSS